MAKAHIQARILGSGVSPETVRASDLAELVISLELAILATAHAKGLVIEDQAPVSLVEISEGNSRLTLAVAANAMLAAGFISQAVASKDYSQIPLAAHENLYKVSRHVIERKWVLELKSGNASHFAAASFSEQNEVHPRRLRLSARARPQYTAAASG